MMDQMLDQSLATVTMLVQSDTSIAFLQALYDQSAQLLTLSTATAAIFVSLSDKASLNNWFLGPGLFVLAVSAVVDVLMLSRLTELMGKGANYAYKDLSWTGWQFIGGGLEGLQLLHLISLVALAVGLLLFVLAKLTG